jgi:hypothetical protein
MTVRYSHLSDDYLKAAVNNVSLGSETTTAAAKTAS